MREKVSECVCVCVIISELLLIYRSAHVKTDMEPQSGAEAPSGQAGRQKGTLNFISALFAFYLRNISFYESAVPLFSPLKAVMVWGMSWEEERGPIQS